MTSTQPSAVEIGALTDKFPAPWQRVERGGLVRILDSKGNGIAMCEPGSSNDVLWSGIVATQTALTAATDRAVAAEFAAECKVSPELHNATLDALIAATARADEAEARCAEMAEGWKPIPSLSTEDHKIVDLKLTDGREVRGYFDGGLGRPHRWIEVRGNYQYDYIHPLDPDKKPQLVHGTVLANMKEGVYPTHWKQRNPDHALIARAEAERDQLAAQCAGMVARLTDVLPIFRQCQVKGRHVGMLDDAADTLFCVVESDIVAAIESLVANAPTAAQSILDRIAALKAVLEFYADPFEWCKAHGEDAPTVDFYSDNEMGERAKIALGKACEDEGCPHFGTPHEHGTPILDRGKNARTPAPERYQDEIDGSGPAWQWLGEIAISSKAGLHNARIEDHRDRDQKTTSLWIDEKLAAYYVLFRDSRNFTVIHRVSFMGPTAAKEADNG